MAQLVEQLLPILEVRSLSPVIGKIHIEHLFSCLLSTVLKRRKKEAGNGQLLKNYSPTRFRLSYAFIIGLFITPRCLSMFTHCAYTSST